MKNIIFIAPPAAGKGTQSDKLVNKYGYIHISTGDLLREEIASGSDLGKEIGMLMETGKLIDTKIVTSLLTKAMSSADKPFILDGYPRNEEQIEILDNILKEINKEIGAVIYLDVPYDTLLLRATGRMICPKCGKTYHNVLMKPKTNGICDNCNEELISRSDDTAETFKVRYETYLESTKPLLNVYESRGLLKVIDKYDNIEDTFNEIENIIR